MAFKEFPRQQRLIPTPSQTTVVIRYAILHYRDPLAADDVSRKNPTNLELQTDGNNGVNDVTLRGFLIDAAGNEKQEILL